MNYDRCRPNFAIELLERVKHIFSLENFVYILGTDTKQLANAIRGVYGSEFDGERYLKRFIDRTYHFQETPKDKLIEFALHRNGLSNSSFDVPDRFDATTFMSKCLDKTKTSARDIKQIIEIIGTFAAAMPISARLIDLVTLLPLVFQRHLQLSDGELIDHDLLKVEIPFTYWSATSGSEERFKNYGVVWNDIEKQSIDNFTRRPPKDSLEEWIRRKKHAELEVLYRETGVQRRQETVRQEYARLLDQVSNITGPDDGMSDM
jgi:hypothetical protein